LFLGLFGCTDNTVPGIPYTTSQMINRSTDLDYDLFLAGAYDGLCLVINDNILTAASCVDANLSVVTWDMISGFPTGCSEGQAVRIIDSALTCVDLPDEYSDGDVQDYLNTLDLNNSLDYLKSESDPVFSSWLDSFEFVDTNCSVYGSCVDVVYWQDANTVFLKQVDANDWFVIQEDFNTLGDARYYLNTNPNGFITTADLTDYLLKTDANNLYAFKTDLLNWVEWEDANNTFYKTTDFNYLDYLTTIEGLNISLLTNDTNYQTYDNIGDFGFLTSYNETDPIFVASPVYNVTAQDIIDWDTAFGWGDHSSQGYVTGTPWTSEGYLTGITGESLGSLSDVDDTGKDTGKVLKYNAVSEEWEVGDIVEGVWTKTGDNISYEDGKVGIGTSPTAVLDVHKQYTSASTGEVLGFRSNLIGDGGDWGEKLISGYFNSSSSTGSGPPMIPYGLYVEAVETGVNADAYGIYAKAAGLYSYGGYFEGTGGDTPYGIYATASGGGTGSYAGYFADGIVKIENNLIVDNRIKGDNIRANKYAIGTDTPTHKVDLRGMQGDRIHIRDTETAESPIKQGLRNIIHQIEWFYPRSGFNVAQARIKVLNYGAVGTGWFGVAERMKSGLSFDTLNEGVERESMTIMYDGKIGINKTDPQYTLDVNGDAIIRNNLFVDKNVTAEAFITTSNVIDAKREESSLSKIENIEEWRDDEGNIDYEKHYAVVSWFETDYDRPETRMVEYEVCDDVIEGEEKVNCRIERVEEEYFPHEKEVFGFNVETRIAEMEGMHWELWGFVKTIQTQITNILNRLTGAEARIESLEEENVLIKNELCRKDNIYSWCRN